MIYTFNLAGGEEVITVVKQIRAVNVLSHTAQAGRYSILAHRLFDKGDLKLADLQEKITVFFQTAPLDRCLKRQRCT